MTPLITHDALDAHAQALLAAESSGTVIHNDARVFCVRRLVRMAAKRTGRADLLRDLERHALSALRDGASVWAAADGASRALLPRHPSPPARRGHA